ncbi:hypothetical protein AB0J40_09125 [Amycolatopsis sp. NPDC049691]|uniref:hypothetical protein n=1 Tax=Amycolatopsis sp. NPDC049691 TaxID=3155155 RepID=UPI003415D37A
MDHSMPDAYTVRAAIALAVRAPSVHNSQPWGWRLAGRTVELRTDPRRHLRNTDPDGRDLLVSCGCALHHFTVAAAATGWTAQVHRLPDPAEPGLLARIDLVPHDTRDGDIALAAAIPRRRSDRRRFAGRPLLVRDEVFLRKSAAVEAGRLHRADPGYAIELAAWSGRNYATDGVPAQNTIQSHPAVRELRVRDFAGARPDDTEGRDGAALTVLSTAGDSALDRLRAGEAASAVLLTATRLNLASCVYTEPLELICTRGLIRDCVLDGHGEPQLVVRIGYLPEGAAPLPATPRRPLGEVVRPVAHLYGVGLPVPARLRGR